MWLHGLQAYTNTDFTDTKGHGQFPRIHALLFLLTFEVLGTTETLVHVKHVFFIELHASSPSY